MLERLVANFVLEYVVIDLLYVVSVETIYWDPKYIIGCWFPSGYVSGGNGSLV